MAYTLVPDSYNDFMRAATVVIADGEVNSDNIPNCGVGYGSFQIPAAITGTTIQPQFSNDGINFTAVGGAISVAADGMYQIPAACFDARFFRLVSNGAEGAARTLTVFLRR